jgi:hypothetical protein
MPYSYRDFTTDAGYLYSHLEALRETALADDLLNRFKALFVEGDRYPESKVLQALHRMLNSAWIEQEFDNVFNRCCYILINYWWLKRNWELTPRLIQLINTATDQPANSGHNTVLKTRLQQFAQSPKYKLLLNCEQVVRFIPYGSAAGVEVIGGLISQYPYLYPYYLREWNNSGDSGQQALDALRHAREQEFEHSLYSYAKGVRREQHVARQGIMLPHQKPTSLSDESLQAAIRAFSGKSEGHYTYQDTAKQTLVKLEKVVDHRAAKHCIKVYLAESIQHTSKPTYGDRKFNHWLGKQLDNSCLGRDQTKMNTGLLMNTCRDLIDALIVPPSRNFENHLMFTDLIANLEATFAMGFVLKIVLLCQKFGENLKAIREHVAARLADLFKYYESYSPDDLKWLTECLDNWLIASTVQFGRWDPSVWTSLIGN